MIRERIAAGILPGIEPDRRWVGSGQRQSCRACDQIILPAQVEHALAFPDGRTIRLHLGCAALYEAALRPGRGKSSTGADPVR